MTHEKTISWTNERVTICCNSGAHRATSCDSRVVPHRGTNWAALRLTAQIERDAVLSKSYGRGYQTIPARNIQAVAVSHGTSASEPRFKPFNGNHGINLSDSEPRLRDFVLLSNYHVVFCSVDIFSSTTIGGVCSSAQPEKEEKEPIDAGIWTLGRIIQPAKRSRIYRTVYVELWKVIRQEDAEYLWRDVLRLILQFILENRSEIFMQYRVGSQPRRPEQTSGVQSPSNDTSSKRSLSEPTTLGGTK
ncbi:hypothetical protein F5888DRAFT_1888136 [Russula emetica]|nr:hypothetical protein F5888DRAFT_1888136 [Russula emetica]